jgi:mannosyl-3-phosphoglycerate synthase (EC 2.4.1.217)/mannosyl-3-phosphoglycerate phosphatase (EC 3.1.3.70)
MKVVFTDLDGTLLDSTYSYVEALDALKLLQAKKIPIVFCSAKTRAEQEVYRKELGIAAPFVVENGGAIFIPEDYFSFPFDYHKVIPGYSVIELGTSYKQLRMMLKEVGRKTGIAVKGFGDMSAEEVAKDSGLSLKFARLAKQREYSETLKLGGDKAKQGLVLRRIKEVGLDYIHGGRYYETMKGNDKGKATRILIRLLRQKFDIVETIGIGDSQNDFPMLAMVDLPVLVQKPDRSWEKINLDNLHRVEGIGPLGWSKTIKEIFGG